MAHAEEAREKDKTLGGGRQADEYTERHEHTVGSRLKESVPCEQER